MTKNKKNGFTLVEVLTVIMIIAILASVVLVSLESARQKTRDATIKNQMSQLRSLAEAGYSFQDRYEGFSQETEKIAKIEDKVDEMEGDLKIEFTDEANNDYSHYCAYSPLASNPDVYFCVDSLGDAVEVDTSVNQFNCKDGTEANCGIIEGSSGDPF